MPVLLTVQQLVSDKEPSRTNSVGEQVTSGEIILSLRRTKNETAQTFHSIVLWGIRGVFTSQP